MSDQPTDEQIRDFLRRNPADFAALVRRDMRLDPGWWRDQLRRMDRVESRWKR